MNNKKRMASEYMIEIEKPLVSIILPTYNRSQLIKRCLDSVLTQTYTYWELIVSDDNSSDNTANVLKELSSDFLRFAKKITININRRREGTPKNRNIALSLSKGDLVFFIEDDLVLMPDCLEKLVETYSTIEKKGIKIAGIVPRLIESSSGHINSDIHKPKANLKKQPFTFNKFTGEIYNNYTEDFGSIQETLISHACSLYQKKAIIEIGGYEENAYRGTFSREESDMNFRLVKKGYRFYYNPKAVAHHKKITTGGSRQNSDLKYYYFHIRNHGIFLVRIFGMRAMYMFPLFLLNITFVRIIKGILSRMI